MSDTTTSRAERAANLFDLRRIIGGVFVTWGVLLNPPLFRPISKVTRTIRRLRYGRA